MPRVSRRELNTTFLHVMVQGINKEYIFNKKIYIELYLKILNDLIIEYNITIIAYCMMNNHAHFLFYTEDINELGIFMKRVNQKFAKLYNYKENRCGSLFRNRYQSEAIYDVKYLINCIKYIHNNPVKAQIVSSCEDYRYSSYKDYMTNKGATQSDIMKRIFGENCNYAVLFRNSYNRKYIDIDNENMDEYINDGIREFIENKNIKIIDILSNRKILIELIAFLKNECKINYIRISEFLKIPRGTMNILKSSK